MHFFKRAARRIPFLSQYYYGWLNALLGYTISDTREKDESDETPA